MHFHYILIIKIIFILSIYGLHGNAPQDVCFKIRFYLEYVHNRYAQYQYGKKRTIGREFTLGHPNSKTSDNKAQELAAGIAHENGGR